MGLVCVEALAGLIRTGGDSATTRSRLLGACCNGSAAACGLVLFPVTTVCWLLLVLLSVCCGWAIANCRLLLLEFSEKLLPIVSFIIMTGELAATLRMCLAAARLTMSRDVKLGFRRLDRTVMSWLLLVPPEKEKECSLRLECELQFSNRSLGEENAELLAFPALLPKDPSGCVKRASKSSNLRSRLGGGGDVETRRFLLRMAMLWLLLLLLLLAANGAGIDEALIIF